jgi:AcrR family transcriptional regulator
MEDKRELILVAARRMFVTLGYPAATISAIAGEARVARGLVHHYFKNKEDLFVQVMKAYYDEALSPAAFDAIPAENPAELATAVVALLRQAFQYSPDLYAMVYESVSVSRRSEPVRTALQEIWTYSRRATEQSIERMLAAGTIRNRLGAKALTTMSIALVHGLGLQLLGEPEVAEQEETWEGLKSTLAHLFDQS